ncbi:MAG: hypothetical protein K2Q97_19500 [Burkholderiaceae bacterium]|nr:hypothetical protein [Burkholderiaceae bacterium]
MPLPIDPFRSATPPIAQFLAEAALQRQTALLGSDKTGTASAPLPVADTNAPPPLAASPGSTAVPLPVPADTDTASFSPQARAQLAAGFDPRRSAAADGSVLGARGDGGLPSALPGLPSGAPLAARPAVVAGAGAQAASAAPDVDGTDWPAAGLGTPLMRMVSALVAQVTAQAGVPQRVVAAQPWPVGMAQALESGALDAAQPPLQTWLVRQGVVQTPDGPRGLALTLRAAVPWLAAQASPSTGITATAGMPDMPGAAWVQVGEGPGASAASASASVGIGVGVGALQVPFAGGGQALQSGVLALVLQGADPAAQRTSALLVLDFQALQPTTAATVYGRDMLQARLDPWTQMAVLQNSGQVPREDERARNSAQGLCDTMGCPYLARAACVQPFCLWMRGSVMPGVVGPV